MYNPRYIVVVLPSPQGSWGWFRRRCSINVVDTTKMKSHYVLDLVNWTQLINAKKNNKYGLVVALADDGENVESPFIKEYLHLDYKRKGPRSKFGRTLAMATLMVEKLNNGEEVDMETFENTVEIPVATPVPRKTKKLQTIAVGSNGLPF